ncbi:MAG: response regulator [Desulfobacterales bacterium]|nr:response regulator [Desulfobacterales bacterium]
MPNILIVDDQACVRELFSQELLREGYRVACIGDAGSVTGHLRSSRPDLVLLDLCLDGLEGFDVLRDIKREYPDLPVIIITAYDSFMDDPRLSQADGYVIKSIHLDELKQKIGEVLEDQPAREVEVETEPCFLRFAEAHCS